MQIEDEYKWLRCLRFMFGKLIYGFVYLMKIMLWVNICKWSDEDFVFVYFIETETDFEWF